MTEQDEAAFEREHGVPVNASGSVIVSRWAVGLAILFLAIMAGAMLLSYFYLRLENPEWPAPGYELPDLGTAAIAALTLVLSGASILSALRRVRRGDQRGFVAALGVTLALALAAVVIQMTSLDQLGVGDIGHAYGSVVTTLVGFLAVVTGAACIMVAMATYWAIRGIYDRRRHAMVRNVATFWAATIVLWLAVSGTIHLGPYLT